jgi:hypothetical protein
MASSVSLKWQYFLYCQIHFRRYQIFLKNKINIYKIVGAKLKFLLYHWVERLMSNGIVTMSQKEIKYLNIIQRVVSGQLTCSSRH